MADEFFNTGLDLNGDGKIDLIEKAFETDDFEHTLDESDGFDNTSSTAKRKTNRGITCLILIIAFGVLLVLINKLPDIIIGVENRIAYTKAEKMITVGDYSNALDELQKILGEYKDSDGLNALCRAHEYESEGDCKMACVCLYDVTFRYQNAEQMREINNFKSRMEQCFYEEVDRETEEERKAEKESVETKAENSGSGKSGYYYKSSKSNSDDDPYNASDYSHPDDFYYDHYDDFWDYEEAEEYYEEHN